MSPCRLPTAEVWDRHAAPHPGIETSERCPRAERQRWPTCLRGWQFPGSRPVAWGARPGRDRLRPAPARPPSRPELTQPAPLACSPSVVDGHAGPVGITHRPVPRLQRPTARFRECSSASVKGERLVFTNVTWPSSSHFVYRGGTPDGTRWTSCGRHAADARVQLILSRFCLYRGHLVISGCPGHVHGFLVLSPLCLPRN